MSLRFRPEEKVRIASVVGNFGWAEKYRNQVVTIFGLDLATSRERGKNYYLIETDDGYEFSVPENWLEKLDAKQLVKLSFEPGSMEEIVRLTSWYPWGSKEYQDVKIKKMWNKFNDIFSNKS